MPNEIFRKLYLKISREYKLAFIITVIFGTLTHLFIFTNRIPNHDSLHSFYHNQSILYSGRFTLGPAASLSSYFDLPWIIGILSVVYLSILVTLIVALFDIKSKLSIILISGLIVTFPTIGATFTYLYTADAYMLGYALALLAIYITIKYKRGFLYSWMLMLFAIGIYQATLSVFLVFSILYIIKRLTETTADIRIIANSLSKLIFTFVISLGIYALIFKIYQKYNNIVSYQGLDEAGNIGLTTIKNALYNSLYQYGTFYFRGFITNYDIKLFEILNVIIFLLCTIMFIKVMVTSKIKLINKIVIFILILLIPFSSFIMYFISPSVEYHTLMKFSLVAVYISLVIIYSEYFERTKKISLSWITIIILIVTIGNNAIINNIAYLNAEIKYERSQSMLNRIAVKSEGLENYKDAKKIMVVGGLKMWTKISSDTVANSIPWMTGAMGEHILTSQSRIRNMFEYYLGVYLHEVSKEQAVQIRESNEYKQMETWPANESVKVIDDVLVIKFN
ncbi:glucosyltransferase domain-containing protein [Solibacillus sp. FSL K6-1523]|uniref:glucosyltransferase domain-containing protein n=1 Tax=Solibacillus sp. FSL K6-1523 TaxID=2921471 RepID=UPI0030FA4ED6